MINNLCYETKKIQEKLWKHTFENELGFDLKGIWSEGSFYVLMSEPPLNHKANREKTTQIMFEKFKVDGFHLAVDAVLAIYATGRGKWIGIR